MLKHSSASVRLQLNEAVKNFSDNTANLPSEQKQLAEQTKIALEKISEQIQKSLKNFE